MQGIRETTVINLRLVFLVLFFLTLVFELPQANAQQNFYDNDLLPASFHKQRREALRALLPPNSCVILFSNPVRNRTNDVDFQFIQDPDLYYLTGLTEPHSALLLFTDPVSISGKLIIEVLFVQDRDQQYELWNGKRLGIEGAVKATGISTVFLNKEFVTMMPDPGIFDNVFTKYPVDIKETAKGTGTLNTMVAGLNSKLIEAGKENQYQPLKKAMAALREIKLPEEIVLMQKAIDITIAGFEEAIRAIAPGMTEYQAQAIVEYYFKHHGSEYPGYNSISGGGNNACVLHYITNRKTLTGNDMLLMDMGAEYHGYTADITRTVPVDGTFSAEQKAIYELVLAAQLDGIAKAVDGNAFHDPHNAALDIIGKGLTQLGIIANPTEVKKYFMHGTSHYLGLEVHDAGNFGKLRPGMVITVEPGIYIPEGSECDKKWWNIGVRIEDDILITDSEPVVMSKALVKTVEELEALMKEESFFNSVK